MALRHTRPARTMPGKTIKNDGPAWPARSRPPAAPAPALAPAFAPARARRGPARGAGRAREGQSRQRTELLAPDATVNFAAQRRDAGVDDLFAALDRELIGLVPVKKKVEQIGALLAVVDPGAAAVRADRDPAEPAHVLHRRSRNGKDHRRADDGRPAAAARLPGHGQLVHAMRDDLVGEYIGQTAPKTKYVLSKAMGGVLFIDEAYSLFRDDDARDYGQECVDILMQVMENHRHHSWW